MPLPRLIIFLPRFIMEVQIRHPELQGADRGGQTGSWARLQQRRWSGGGTGSAAYAYEDIYLGNSRSNHSNKRRGRSANFDRA
jgi:hypothetical protein